MDPHGLPAQSGPGQRAPNNVGAGQRAAFATIQPVEVCPITLEAIDAMPAKDVFTTEDGKRYNAAALKMWLSQQPRIPHTNLPASAATIRSFWPRSDVLVEQAAKTRAWLQAGSVALLGVGAGIFGLGANAFVQTSRVEDRIIAESLRAGCRQEPGVFYPCTPHLALAWEHAHKTSMGWAGVLLFVGLLTAASGLVLLWEAREAATGPQTRPLTASDRARAGY